MKHSLGKAAECFQGSPAWRTGAGLERGTNTLKLLLPLATTAARTGMWLQPCPPLPDSLTDPCFHLDLFYTHLDQ